VERAILDEALDAAARAAEPVHLATTAMLPSASRASFRRRASDPGLDTLSLQSQL
jgi:hypothetical protein